jgi:hypothetical protein
MYRQTHHQPSTLRKQIPPRKNETGNLFSLQLLLIFVVLLLLWLLLLLLWLVVVAGISKDVQMNDKINISNYRVFLFQVYQVYARKTPQEVNSILKKHGADYIILENSICYSRQSPGCKLKDILDMDNGHVIEGGQPEPGLKFTDIPRFCAAIKYDYKHFAKYFKKVFENRTFYLYKVL